MAAVDDGLSQGEAGEKSDRTRRTINRLENAGNYPGVATLMILPLRPIQDDVDLDRAQKFADRLAVLRTRK